MDLDYPQQQQQQQQALGGSSSEKHPIDDASLHTITASSLQMPPQMQQSSNNIPTPDDRPRTSYSDTGFSRPFSADNTPDHQSQQQNGNGLSRPQSQNAADGQRQQAQKNSSVVIKVGMVGDAQIGKTSLMVKYVEGSWDEDYIQTLGTPSPSLAVRIEANSMK